jgi:alkaline phosphatase D
MAWLVKYRGDWMKKSNEEEARPRANRSTTWALLVGLAIVVAAAPGVEADSGGVPVFTDGVASGDVTATSAILWTRIDRDTNVKVEVWGNPELKGMKAFQQTVPHVSAAHDFTVKIDATALSPDTDYYYRFKHDDTDGASFSEIGSFRTAPSPDVAGDLRFTYTADADGTRDAYADPFRNEFEVLNAARLEGGAFWVFDGDTIYSDSSFRSGGPATTLAEYHATHRENRSYANLRELLASTSVYATMDDHEVVNDYDADTVDPARYAAGRQAFLDYYPVRETGLLHDATCAGDPLYRKFRWGSEVEVFLLDERSCRSASAVATCQGDLAPTLPTSVRTSYPFSLFLPPTPPPGCLETLFDPARTLLGPVQREQLFADLAASTARWKLIVSEEPVQQFHVLPYDRYEGYAAERAQLLTFILQNGIDGVQFLSTDIHATLLNQVVIDRFTAPAPVAVELVTGPIAATSFASQVLGVVGESGLQAVNFLLSFDGVDCRNLNQNSYGLAEVSAGAGTLDLASKDENGALVVDPTTSGQCTISQGP